MEAHIANKHSKMATDGTSSDEETPKATEDKADESFEPETVSKLESKPKTVDVMPGVSPWVGQVGRSPYQ